MVQPIERFRIATFGRGYAPWRGAQEAAMAEAIQLELGSYDRSRRTHFLAGPMEMQIKRWSRRARRHEAYRMITDDAP